MTLSHEASALRKDAEQQAKAFLGGSTSIGVLPHCAALTLREHCIRHLPAYMVPQCILFSSSDVCFQTSNGKRNGRLLDSLESLSGLQSSSAEVEQESEGSAAENFIAGLWRKRLGSGMVIQPWDSFVKLGGDSLDAQRVVQDIVSLLADHPRLSQDFNQLLTTSRTSGDFRDVHTVFSPAALLSSEHLRDYVHKLLQNCPQLSEVIGSSSALNALGQSQNNPQACETLTKDVGLNKALIEATSKGYRSVVQLLLNKRWGLGVDVDANVGRRERRGKTPLHVAAGLGDEAMVKLLLSHGANVFATNEDKTPPIHVAAAANSSSCSPLGVVKYLSDAMKLWNVPCAMVVRDGRRQTVLHAAARGGDPETLQYVIQELRDSRMLEKHIHGLDRWNRTALHWAAVNGHLKCCEVLVAEGADPWIKRLTRKSTHLPYERPGDIAKRKGFNAIAKLFSMKLGAETDSSANM